MWSRSLVSSGIRPSWCTRLLGDALRCQAIDDGVRVRIRELERDLTGGPRGAAGDLGQGELLPERQGDAGAVEHARHLVPDRFQASVKHARHMEPGRARFSVDLEVD